MTVRAARDDEVDLVCDMRVAFLTDDDGAEPPEGFREQTRSFLRARQDAGELRSWLAFDGEQCVGIVSVLLAHVPPRVVDPTTREGYVVNMYVVPSHRRRGLAQELLDACLEHARAAPLRRLYLYATDAGRPLYERNGFAPGVTWMHRLISGS